MYAVIRSGGKQYRVAKDMVLKLERLPGAAGDAVSFDEVLLLGDGAGAQIGSPLVAGASVQATVLEQMRGPKIVVFKKRRRKHYRRKTGHRQDLTVVRVTGIQAGAAA
jgi:large subunit ribosomal protein L21